MATKLSGRQQFAGLLAGSAPAGSAVMWLCRLLNSGVIFFCFNSFNEISLSAGTVLFILC